MTAKALGQHMKRIWKYPLAAADQQRLSLPLNHRMLSAQLQGNEICIWVLVHPGDGTRLDVEIRIYKTGNPVPDDPGTFLATVQDPQGLVWHVFYAPMV